jgi:hypothetical protein
MNQQTPDQGWQELQAHIEGFFDQVLRVEKEKAILSRIAAGPEAEKGQSDMPMPDRQSRDKEDDWAPDRVSYPSAAQPCQCPP